MMIDNGHRIVCCRCGAHIAGPKDAPPERTSHGLCAKCMAEIMREGRTINDSFNR